MAWLITDVLLWLLFILFVVWLNFALRQPQWRHAFSTILSQQLCLSATIILLLYIVIGLLDSLHFQSLTETYSLLDKLLDPIEHQFEVSY